MAIEAAVAILNQEGVHGLSTRKVAKRIGYTVGTLYLVFENLDELILHVNAAALDELHKILESELAADRIPQQQLFAMSHAYLRFARDNFARWSLLFTHRLPESAALPEWFTDKVQKLFALVARPLKQLQPALSEPDCRRTTYVVWSSVHGVCELVLNDKLSLGGDIQPEALIDAVMQNFLKGFMLGRE